jgi:hypothetical protein
MQFNIEDLIRPNVAIDSSSLEEPFSIDEIDDIVKNMPTNKSPGPDVFSGAFLKKCW